MIRVSVLAFFMVLLSGCGHVRIDYVPHTNIGQDEAVSIIEQVFSEDFGELRAQGVVLTDQYILLSDGVLTRGKAFGSAVPVGNSAIALASSESVTRELGQRIYYNSLGNSTLHTKRNKQNRYVVLIRNKEGAVQRTVNTTNLQKAERFIDALEYFKRRAG